MSNKSLPLVTISDFVCNSKIRQKHTRCLALRLTGIRNQLRILHMHKFEQQNSTLRVATCAFMLVLFITQKVFCIECSLIMPENKHKKLNISALVYSGFFCEYAGLLYLYPFLYSFIELFVYEYEPQQTQLKQLISGSQLGCFLTVRNVFFSADFIIIKQSVLRFSHLQIVQSKLLTQMSR